MTLLTTKEVSILTGVGYSTVKARCKIGEIPTVMDGKRYLIRSEDIQGLTVHKRGRKPKCHDPPVKANTITAKLSEMDIPSTPSEKTTTTYSTSMIQKLRNLVSILDTCWSRNTSTPKESNGEQSPTLLTSWSRTTTGGRR